MYNTSISSPQVEMESFSRLHNDLVVSSFKEKGNNIVGITLGYVLE